MNGLSMALIVIIAFLAVGWYITYTNWKIKKGKMQDYIDDLEGNPTHNPSKRKRKF